MSDDTSILDEIKEIGRDFSSFSFSFVHRAVNVGAHRCAKICFTLDKGDLG